MFEITPIRNASVGRAQTARIRIVPGAGFHINTAYPFVVQLADAPGLKLEKQRFEGGKRGAVGDAETLAEEELAIPIRVTPTTSGEHTLNGTINFGICKATSCLQRSDADHALDRRELRPAGADATASAIGATDDV